MIRLIVADSGSARSSNMSASIARISTQKEIPAAPKNERLEQIPEHAVVANETYCGVVIRKIEIVTALN